MDPGLFESKFGRAYEFFNRVKFEGKNHTRIFGFLSYFSSLLFNEYSKSTFSWQFSAILEFENGGEKMTGLGGGVSSSRLLFVKEEKKEKNIIRYVRRASN